MTNIILPEFYPYMPIIVGLFSIILFLYLLCYRHSNPSNVLMIAFSAMVFLHLDLLAYNMTYPLYQRILDFFVFQNIETNLSWVIRIIALIVLSLPPFLVWLIPMIMMDEKLIGDTCCNERITQLKSAVFFLFGLAMNAIFVYDLFLSQGLLH